MRGVARSLARLGMALTGTIFGLLILELGVRLAKPHELPRIDYSAHAVFHHRLPVNATIHDETQEFKITARTNNLALRGAALTAAKPPGVRRLLVLGDSFTFGVGVQDDETFCVLLQQAFDRQQAAVEVINAGTGSYSPILQYLTLRDLYLQLKPDAVLLLFDFNDLSDDFHYEPHLRYGADGQVIACNPDTVHGRVDWAGRLIRHSALAHFLHRKCMRSLERMQILGLKRYLLIKLRGGSTKTALTQVDPEKDMLAHDSLFMIRGRLHLSVIERHWQLTGGFILKIRDLLRGEKIPFILGIFPHGVQVGAQQWAIGRVELGFEPGKVYNDPAPFDFVKAFAAKEGIAVIDLWPAFLQSKEKKLFYDWDGHFTPAGHRVVAEALLEDAAFHRLLESMGAPDRWYNNTTKRGLQ